MYLTWIVTIDNEGKESHYILVIYLSTMLCEGWNITNTVTNALFAVTVAGWSTTYN